MKKFTHKKMLVLGAMLLALSVFLMIFGNYVYNSANDTLEQYRKNYDDAIARKDFQDAGYWYLQEEVKLETIDGEQNLGTALFVIGFLMIIASFILLLVGVFKKEKKIMKL